MPNMDGFIDLHTHSNYSDGTDSPGTIVRKARDSGLRAVGLTDHDTAAGLDEFVECGKEYGIETVCGIELSTQMGDAEVHVLGYYLDCKNDAMKNYMIEQEMSRQEKNSKTFARLHDIGFDITFDDFHESKGVVTRGSIAGVMLKKGFVGSIQEAFEVYIGEGMPAFVDRKRISIEKALEVIIDCGGIPVMAHPYLLEISDSLFESELGRLVAAGLRGIEILYPGTYPGERVLFYRQLAEKYSMLVTGGSDYHGENKTEQLGCVFDNERVPYKLLDALKQQACIS